MGGTGVQLHRCSLCLPVHSFELPRWWVQLACRIWSCACCCVGGCLRQELCRHLELQMVRCEWQASLLSQMPGILVCMADWAVSADCRHLQYLTEVHGGMHNAVWAWHGWCACKLHGGLGTHVDHTASCIYIAALTCHCLCKPA
jgi:hypothetical protein